MNGGSGRAQAGFTLVEVMIAAAILGFIILGLGSLSAFTTRTTTYARRANAAASIARNAIETARNTPYVNLPTLDTDPAAAPARPAACFDKDLAPVACAAQAAIFTRTTRVCAEQSLVRVELPRVCGAATIAGLTEFGVLVTWLDDKRQTRRTELATSISRY